MERTSGIEGLIEAMRKGYVPNNQDQQELSDHLREIEDKFKRILKGITKAYRKALEKIRSEFKIAVTRIPDDQRYRDKRALSHRLLDELLEVCQAGHCPDLTKDPDLLYLLSDISIEGYVREKAYFYHETGEGESDEARYYTALKRIEHILGCSSKPSLDCDLIDRDAEEVSGKFFVSARRRKAYWSYLRYRPGNNRDTDYCGACGFIEQLHGLASGKKCTSDDLEKAKQIVIGNKHIANGLDLFRLCVIRKNMEPT